MFALVLRPVLATIVLALAAFGAGRLTFPRLSSAFSEFDRRVLSWLAGFGFLSLALFLIGQWRFTPSTISPLIGIAALAGVKPLVALTSVLRESFRQYPFPRLPALLVLLVVSSICLAGLAEITGDWSIDAVVYHLLGPKVWIRDGVIRPLPDNSHTAMPQTGETIYAAAMVFGGQRAPGFSNSITFIMLLLVAASVARRAGLSSNESWWAILMISTMPAVVTGSTHVFVDGLYASFVLAAARVAFDAVTIHDFIALSIFGGLAMGTKYTGLLAVPAILFCLLLKKAMEHQLAWTEIRKASFAFMVACLIASPYYLRNWLLLGSPIFPPPPLLWRIFPAKYLSTGAVLHFHEYIRQRGKGFGRGVGAFFLLPFNLSYHTSNFFGAGGIGICPLGLAPFGIVTARRNLFARALAILGLLLGLLWFITQQESRFLIHGYVLGAIFAMFGWRYAKSLGLSARILAAAIVAMSVGYGMFMLSYTIRDIESVISPAAAAARERATIPFLESFTFLNRDPSVKRVLVLDLTVPPYYLDKPYVRPVGPWGERTLPGAPDVAQSLARIREWRVSHVMDVRSEVAPFAVADGTRGLRLVFAAPNQRVYRVE